MNTFIRALRALFREFRGGTHRNPRASRRVSPGRDKRRFF